MGFGRVRTESLHRFWLDFPALLCGLAPRPLNDIVLSPFRFDIEIVELEVWRSPHAAHKPTRSSNL
jgi:hypothetical protein